jgi:amino acid transporter
MLSLVFLVIITWGNLRGMRESSLIFSLPTYCFIVGLLALLAVAAWKFVILGMRPYPPHEVDVARLLSTTAEPLTLFMILRAFSGGCTALTGIEAISNGVPAFRKPESRNAATTLIIMAFIAMTMFVGLTWFAHHLRHLYPERPILALPMNVAGIPYQTVVSQIARATFGGQSWFYFFIQIATMAILVVAANTAFADFPRLSSVMARDGFLPRQLMNLGDKLVFQNGILTLSAVAGVLIVWSAGHTHKLLPLYAVGVFIAFTCSQAGMMVWQTRHRQPRWQFKAGLNAVGAAVTSIVALILFITKFHDGAWVVGLLLALLFLLFHTVSRHYADNRRKLEIRDDFSAPGKTSSRALVLVPRVHMGIL